MFKARRDFVCGGLACAAGLRVARGSWAQEAEADLEDEEISLCGTNETAIQGQFAIQDFAAGGSTFEIQTALEEFRITEYGTAMLSQRWRRDDGLTPNTGVITIGCFFMSGSSDQRMLVQQSAQGWLQGGIDQLIRFDFNVPQERSQVRVLIGASGNNSRIGRDALRVPVNQPTLNLHNVVPGTIQHEFGHALGLMHEHLNPEFTVPLREDVVIQDMAKPPNNWTQVTTRLNIINKMGTDAQCVGDPSFNEDSIMMYEIPRRWTVHRKGFKRAKEVQERDIRCVRGLYSIGT